jgi:predicted GNAT family acetyltransferase
MITKRKKKKMPNVGGKEFSYTAKGMAAAKMEEMKTGKKMVVKKPTVKKAIKKKIAMKKPMKKGM